jgi:CDP-paratose 2-epimerase
VNCIEDTLGTKAEIRFAEWRAGDQRYFVSDTRRAAAALGLRVPKPWRLGLRELAAWFAQERQRLAGPLAVGAA